MFSMNHQSGFIFTSLSCMEKKVYYAAVVETGIRAASVKELHTTSTDVNITREGKTI